MARGLDRPDERRADEPGPPISAIFGDGGHPTTRSALEALRAAVGRRPGARVLDAGCGTGVLAEAAFAFGAMEVVAIDRDPAAGRRTAERVPRARVLVGELGALLPGLGAFQVVVANLFEHELLPLAPALARTVAPGGQLIATGIRLWRGAALERALWASGLTPRPPRARDGWVLLAAHRGDADRDRRKVF